VLRALRVVVVPVGISLALAAGALPASVAGAAPQLTELGAPATLAQSVPVDGRVAAPDFAIEFVGVTWTGDHGAATVRFRHGGAWTPWRDMGEDGLEEPGKFASSLVPAGDADAYQVRVPDGVTGAESVAINTTDGKRTTVAAGTSASAVATATTSGGVVSRAAWGADERIRTWGPSFHPPQKLTVHHTAGLNDDPNPAATVRAIYRFHTVDRGWGDIGYQFLVDAKGTVYEGRYTDTNPITEPAFDEAGGVVVGAHVANYNNGNVGISLLGTYDTRRPSLLAQRSLERLLATLSIRTGISPDAWSWYENPLGGARWLGPNILGHRHLGQTACPGKITYALLPTLRKRVAQRVAGTLTADIRMAPPRQIVVTTAATRARIKWRTAGDPSDTQLTYWPKGRPGQARTTRLDMRFSENHEVLLTGLARGSYEYRMVDADEAGNRYVSGVNRFRTR
jgi:N-acetylmuramoyl-L-alanine amidase